MVHNEGNVVQVLEGPLYDNEDKYHSECYKKSKIYMDLNHKRAKLNRIKKYSSILNKLDRYQHNVIRHSVMHITMAIILTILFIIFKYIK